MFLRRDTEIYRHLTSKCFKNCCSSWESRNKTAPFLQLFFLKPNKNVFAGKFVKSKRVLARLWEHVIFNIIEVEVHHMNEVFWAKLYCKMSDLFRWFLTWLWDFLLENLKLKKNIDHVHWNVQTNIKKLYD